MKRAAAVLLAAVLCPACGGDKTPHDRPPKTIVVLAIAETGASSLKEMGKVMGLLTKQLAGRATGARISQVVKERLS